MEALEIYTSVLTAVSIALLSILAGQAKTRLVWKSRPVRPRRRRRG